MSQDADESVDKDLLLAFSTEPGGKPPESTESLGLRVECLERSLLRSTRQVESLRSEVATLVTAVNDIKTPQIRAATKSRRPRTASAVAATIVGVALGMAGWMAWSAESVDVSATRSVPVVTDELPRDAEPPPVAAITLTSTPPAQRVVNDVPVRAITRVAEDDIQYVGTLSIDADPIGGQVFIDRRAAGTTPLRVENLKAGSHLVWIERDGYRRWTQVVQVRSDRVSRVSASLSPLPAP